MYNLNVFNRKFQIIFLLSIFLNYIHGIECIATKFYDINPNFYIVTQYFQSIHESVYYVFHFSFWVFILLAFFLIKGGKWIFVPLSLYGTIFFTESHHFIRGILLGHYLPGMITSVLFPILGIFYWKEVLNLWKTQSKLK